MRRLTPIALALALLVGACTNTEPEVTCDRTERTLAVCPEGMFPACGSDAYLECRPSGGCGIMDECGIAVCGEDGPYCSGCDVEPHCIPTE